MPSCLSLKHRPGHYRYELAASVLLRDQRFDEQMVCGALEPADIKTAEPNGNLNTRTEPSPTKPDQTESDGSELHRTDLQIISAVAAAMLARVRKITLVVA